MQAAMMKTIAQEGSSVWCTGDTLTTRICHFNNLCYSMNTSSYIFTHGKSSTMVGIPASRNRPAFLELSSVQDLNIMYMDMADVTSSFFSDPSIQADTLVVEGLSFIQKRFHGDNIMHVLHDDLMPLYYTMRQFSYPANAGGGMTEQARGNHQTSEGLPADTSTHINLDSRIAFMDDYSPGPHYDLFRAFSRHPPIVKEQLMGLASYVCFQDAVVGVNKMTTWYQYGYDVPQGPIPGKQVSGWHVRQFTEFMRSRLRAIHPEYALNEESIVGNALAASAAENGASQNHRPVTLFSTPRPTPRARQVARPARTPVRSPANGANRHNDDKGPIILKNGRSLDEEDRRANPDANVPPAAVTFSETQHVPLPSDIIVLFTRQRNRILINQQEFIDALQREFKMPVIAMGMETHNFAQQVMLLKRAKIAIGLHGSMLIMAAFMPVQSILIELFPYAVPSENYTPYKTLVSFPDMHMVYRAWENKHKDGTIAHPEYSTALGGILHLDTEMQAHLQAQTTVPAHLCCTDPSWLFHIYQDTRVHIGEVTALIRDALHELHTRETGVLVNGYQFFSTQMENGRCTKATTTSITVEWDSPWNSQMLIDYHEQTQRNANPSSKQAPRSPVRIDSQVFVEGSPAIYQTHGNEMVIATLTPGTEYSVYLRPIVVLPQANLEGRFGSRISCKTLPLPKPPPRVLLPPPPAEQSSP
ncbi:glycosyltransferase ago61, variant 3 [Capsaspora owczarzaki ATCC 30864]|nr:glycosyltransferase ago61, variant 2 [Capsaspora owczarzaki ATCC 30864]KJE89273.1 glycosyltransferase ago61, variant 3 [Capsaspora owczarzaki ATCC 30864]